MIRTAGLLVGAIAARWRPLMALASFASLLRGVELLVSPPAALCVAGVTGLAFSMWPHLRRRAS